MTIETKRYQMILGLSLLLLGSLAVGFSRRTTPQETADLLLHHGKIVTVDDAFAIRQAVAVRDGKIIAVEKTFLGGKLVYARNSAASPR